MHRHTGLRRLLSSNYLASVRCRLYSTNIPGGQSRQVPDTSRIPPVKIHRVTYEYPPPPKPKPEPPKESSVWKRHIPLLIGVGGLVWAGYAAYYFLGDSKSNEQDVLTPERFSTFKITHREEISNDLVLLEIAPKYAASQSLLKSSATLWNGKRIWSIQVKHPLIQIARHYTPLPLYFMQSDRPGEPALLRMMGTANDEGRMCLLIRRYEDGEMSRYLHSLPRGSDVEIRGPFIDHKFPYEPADSQKLRQPMLDIPTRMVAEPELDPTADYQRASNIAMFTAGTGITAAFQMLLSPFNPPRGFTHVYHSARKREDIPFDRFILFLESAGRARFHTFVDEEGQFIGPRDIPAYTEPTSSGTEPSTHPGERYASVVQQFQKFGCSAYSSGVSAAVVCGPPGYIAYVSGDPGFEGTNPIGGLLGKQGWTTKNTKRLLDV